MDDMRSCAKLDDVEAFRSCVLKALPETLRTESAREILDMFETESTPSRCHDIGHLIGRELLKKSGSLEAALLRCSNACASACAHGAAGAALASIPELSDSFGDSPHVDPKVLLDAGTDACKDRETCHGVGHILIQLFKDLDVALEWCDVIAGDSEPWACYRGVFMENASFNSSHVISEEARVSNMRDPENFLYPCTAVKERYQPACFHNIHMNQSITLHERGVTDKGEKVRLITAACEGAAGRMQAPCYEGVGSYLAINAYPSREAMDRCFSLHGTANVAACVFGFAYALSAWGRTDDALDVCTGLAEEMAQFACYESIADDVSVRPSRSLESMCDGVATVACAHALESVRAGSEIRSVIR